MDYLGEILFLGIDTVILGICLRQYYYCKNAIGSVKEAKFYDAGQADFNQLMNDGTDKKIDYVAIKGAVKSLGTPLQSLKTPDITGVIQKLTTKEHVVARSTAGFWSDQERTIQNVSKAVSFALQHGPHSIEITDPLAADMIDLDVVSDYFEPSVPTFSDHLWGFFTGVRQRGLQTTEEMLREGAIIIGIGELSKSPINGETLLLQKPMNGAPFYLTTMSLTSLVRKLDDRKRIYRWLCIMFGTIGIITAGVLARHFWKVREEERLKKKLRQMLAVSRKERRQRVRDRDLRDDQLCVVCRSNPREIILLPCGHVCLCEDCSDDISNNCPVCRASISEKAPAYII